MSTDQMIVEALGGCWHEWKRFTPEVKGWDEKKIHGLDRIYYQCVGKCKEVIWPWLTKCPENPDLSTWPGFGWAWERAQKMEWWDNFLFLVARGRFESCSVKNQYSWEALVNPICFRDALYQFLSERKDPK